MEDYARLPRIATSTYYQHAAMMFTPMLVKYIVLRGLYAWLLARIMETYLKGRLLGCTWP